MNKASAGITLALLVAGWPLYRLVAAGDLDLVSAILRGGIVALGCAIGVGWLVRLASSYEQQHVEDKKKRLNDLFDGMEEAVSSGTIREDGTIAGEDPAADDAAPQEADAGPTGG